MLILAIGFIIFSTFLLRLFPSSRGVALIFSLIYGFAVIYVTFLIREPAPLMRYSFDFFRAAKRGLQFGGGVIHGILTGSVTITSWYSLRGILLNILLFVSFGYLMPSLWGKMRTEESGEEKERKERTWTWWRVLLAGFLASLTIEMIQLVHPFGLCRC